MSPFICLVFLLALNADVISAEMESPRYDVSVFRGGVPEKEYIAEIERFGAGYRIVSEVARDIVLTPVSTSNPGKRLPAAGRYDLVFKNHELAEKRFKAWVEPRGGNIRISGENNLSIYLVRKKSDPVLPVTQTWRVPFPSENRKDVHALEKKALSRYGEYRASKKKGHRHAGIDIKGGWREPVYAIAKGKVVFISHHDLNGVVLIKHRKSNGSVVYSKYVHLKDVEVKPGQVVDEHTVLGAMFNEKTFKRSRYKFNHVHMEIRKTYSDKGRASSYSMLVKELNKYCFDPILFLKNNIK